MGKPTLTLQDFLIRSQVAHGGRYDYSLVNFKGAKEQVDVLCRIHGKFTQRAENHWAGKGCNDCAQVVRLSKRRDSLEMFITKSRKVHGDKFDYSQTVYLNDHTRLDIICPVHGKINVSPMNHKAGRDCQFCANTKRGVRNNLQEFVEKANEVHGGIYEYSEIETFCGDLIKIPIKCRVHGVFYQRPGNHKMGAGCNVCKAGGYNQKQPGSLYLLSSGNEVKVGITNKTAKLRAKFLSNVSGMDFEVVLEMHSKDGESAPALERQLLNWLRIRYKAVDKHFNGSTECFECKDIDEILCQVRSLVY